MLARVSPYGHTFDPLDFAGVLVRIATGRLPDVSYLNLGNPRSKKDKTTIPGANRAFHFCQNSRRNQTFPRV